MPHWFKDSPAWEYKLRLLLVSLLSLFLVSPFFDNSLTIDILMSTVVLFSLYALQVRRRTLVLCMILAGMTIATTWATFVTNSWPVFKVSLWLDLLYMGLLGTLILLWVLRSRRVTSETVAGAICVYLIIGIVWGTAYGILETVDPGSFSGLDPATSETPKDAQASRISEFSYFSFVTLSTLGYGEITPTTRLARSLATLEAITGQLFLAVLIARLVGLHIAESMLRRSD